jgi:hypothetical protein
MSIEQVEDAILALAPEEHRQLLEWFDEDCHELFGGAESTELTEAQKAEMLKRRDDVMSTSNTRSGLSQWTTKLWTRCSPGFGAMSQLEFHPQVEADLARRREPYS